MTPQHLQEIDNLLPCPFCGGNDLKVLPDCAEDDNNRIYAYHVFCQDCHARGRNHYPISYCESERAAKEAWNDRFVPATIPGNELSTTALKKEWEEKGFQCIKSISDRSSHTHARNDSDVLENMEKLLWDCKWLPLKNEDTFTWIQISGIISVIRQQLHERDKG